VTTSFERVFGLLAKEFRQIFRDPRMARVIFIAPLFQLLAFGYAVSTDLRDASMFVVDHDNTRESRDLVSAIIASGYFDVTMRSQAPADLVRALDHGDAVLGLEIPRGYAQAWLGDGGAAIQVLIDGTNSNTAAVAQGYITRIIEGRPSGRVMAGATLPIDLRERAWYNPELSSRNYNVPGVVGTLIMLVCLLLTSLAIVREREIGTLEQLKVSPLTAGELIVGKTLPFGIIAMGDMVLVTTVAVLWFGVPLRGSLLLLFFASILFVMAGLGMGLLISTVSKTQQEAFMGTFLVFMPTLLLSGFMFPVSSMPEIFQDLTILNPVRHYIEIVRAIFLKGIGLDVLWPQFLALLLLGTTLLTLATLRFRREIA
jgi:ABC-2 type transport system permease protein